MTIQRAIQKAIEGGYAIHWDEKMGWAFTNGVEGTSSVISNERILLDISFWQCLGKSMGWKTVAYTNTKDIREVDEKEWLYHWHRLIDHLAEGNNIEEFFKTL